MLLNQMTSRGGAASLKLTAPSRTGQALTMQRCPIVVLAFLGAVLLGLPVIPPFLEGVWRRTHAVSCVFTCRFSFWAGVMPPKAMFGRS